MNVVVADTSPLQYLHQCGAIDLLPRLFGRVIVPKAVLTEPEHPAAPPAIRPWLATHPGWLEIRQANTPVPIQGLDPGEVEARQLAMELAAAAILLDDATARQVARRRGLQGLGTLGIIELGARQGLVPFDPVVERLQQTNIFLAPNLIEAARSRVQAVARGSTPEN